jgi:hypothetical protein
VQPESFDPFHCGARRIGWLSIGAQAVAERIRCRLSAKQRLHCTDDEDGFLVIPAGSIDELHTILGLAEELSGCTGCSVVEGRNQVSIHVTRYSDEEVREIWRRIVSGEAPDAALDFGKGPRDQFLERLRREVRRGRRESGSDQTIEIRHKESGEVLHRVGGDSLAGADLAGAELDGADLAGANLSGAELQGAHLEGSDLAGAILRGADLRGAFLPHSNMQAADLAEARLQGAFCWRAILPGANLRAADLSGAVLSSSNLCAADLRNANLAGTRLGAKLFGADLTGTRPASAVLEGAGYDAHTRWPNGFDPRRHRARRIGWLLSEPPPESIVVDEALAIEIAQRAVAANDGPVQVADDQSIEVAIDQTAPVATYEYSATPDGEGWRVGARLVERRDPDGEPGYIRGGRRVIVIDRGGRVTWYIYAH